MLIKNCHVCRDNNNNTMASALASLTANYTDSEGEEDLKGDNSDQETGDR